MVLLAATGGTVVSSPCAARCHGRWRASDPGSSDCSSKKRTCPAAIADTGTRLPALGNTRWLLAYSVASGKDGHGNASAVVIATTREKRGVATHLNSKSAANPVRAEVQRRIRSVWREYAEALIIAVLLALVIRTFAFQAFVIPSGSMLPTLRIGDYLLVNKFVYLFRPIRRGDIIVFRFPKDETRDFIKRVVGLPAETLEIRDNQVFIDGRPLHEAYAVYSEPRPLRPPGADHLGPMVIPPGHLFVMGDNRDNSLDSRAWGLLEEAKVVGEASIIYFSVRIAAIPHGTLLPQIFYTMVHPSLMRWGRIGRLVR